MLFKSKLNLSSLICCRFSCISVLVFYLYSGFTFLYLLSFYNFYLRWFFYFLHLISILFLFFNVSNINFEYYLFSTLVVPTTDYFIYIIASFICKMLAGTILFESAPLYPTISCIHNNHNCYHFCLLTTIKPFTL